MVVISRIVKKIIYTINKIKYGFNIIPGSYEADGCDEYGTKYWIECYNGWGGRDWEVPSEIDRRIIEMLDNINNNGIDIDGNTYYLTSIRYIRSSKRMYNKDIFIIPKYEFKLRQLEKKKLKIILSKISPSVINTKNYVYKYKLDHINTNSLDEFKYSLALCFKYNFILTEILQQSHLDKSELEMIDIDSNYQLYNWPIIQNI